VLLFLQWISHVIGGVDHAPLRTEACALVANLCRCNIEHQNKAQMSGVELRAPRILDLAASFSVLSFTVATKKFCVLFGCTLHPWSAA